jgi:hypothetical protein
MKKYPFAKLYLSLLLVLAGLALLMCVGTFIGGAIDIFKHTSDISTLKKSPKEFDTNLLFTQMANAQAVVKAVSPDAGIELPPAGNLPVSEYAQLDHKQVKQLHVVIERCAVILPVLKAAYLKAFNENIGKLEAAARERLSQLRKRDAPAFAAMDYAPLTTALYDNAALGSSQIERLNAVSSFLENDVRNYSPSDAAYKAASAANKNLLAAMTIYVKDYDISRQNALANIFSPSSSPAPQRPQDEVLSDFIDKLQTIKRSAQGTLVNGWAIESTTGKIEDKIDKYFARIEAMKVRRLKSFSETGKSLFTYLGVAILLLVIRDFFSTAIDTAQNTAAMKDTLAGVDVKYN